MLVGSCKGPDRFRERLHQRADSLTFYEPQSVFPLLISPQASRPALEQGKLLVSDALSRILTVSNKICSALLLFFEG